MSEGDAATDGVGWAGLGRRWVREMSAMGERDE